MDKSKHSINMVYYTKFMGVLLCIEDAVKVSAKDAIYTNPDEAVEFVQRTGCNSLAIAIGTSYGASRVMPEFVATV